MLVRENKPLSSRKIESMKPGAKVMSDTGENRGLRVSCGNAGTKTFFYRYTNSDTKKLVQIKIGNFPVVSLAQAREELRELKVIRKTGRCPATELKIQKQEEKERLNKVKSGFTIKKMIDLYLSEYIEDRSINDKIIKGARKPKGQSEVRRTLYGDAVRVLGDRIAIEVTRKDIVNLVLEIVGRGANVQAGNVLRELTSAYEYSIGLDKIDENFANPALSAKAGLRQAKVRLTCQRGRRVLSDMELAKLLKWLPGSVYTPTQKNVLRFMLWTACRSGEVCEAQWKDVDLDNATWHLRETKTGSERHVQLSDQAVGFLKLLKMNTGDCLFPSQRTRIPIQQKSLTEQAWQLRQAKRMVDIKHWTPHDLRRTVRTGLSRLGCPSEVAEAILGHARSGIEGTYDLHGYEKECREWLQRWADHIEGLLSTD